MVSGKLSMPLSAYLRYLAGMENQELSMKIMLSPFKICYRDGPEDGFLTGHLIEALLEQWHPKREVDAFDIASCAWELGFDPAGHFLEHGHFLVTRQLCGV